MTPSAIIEALLTSSDAPLPTEELARILRAHCAEAEDSRARKIEDGLQPDPLPDWISALANFSPVQALATIHELNEHYTSTGRAFLLLERPNGWKLYTRPEFGDCVRHLFPGRKPERLSGPAMETLAIIAYRQPITKAAIEAVRGVACDGMIQKLLDRELIRISGRADLPGRPLLYETTDQFFEHFGIRSIDDLPNAGELRTIKLPEPQAAQPTQEPEQQLALASAPSAADLTQPGPAPTPDTP